MQKIGLIDSIKYAFQNMGLIFFIKIKEVFIFGLNPWWWKLYYYLFIHYLPDSCYRLARRESQKISRYTFLNYGYGEAPTSTVKAMLEGLNLQDFQNFTDLGSGRGAVVFNVHFLYNTPAEGMEILPGHIKRSEKIKKLLKIKNVTFLNEDILDAGLDKKSIYYCSSTSFDADLIEKLGEKLREIPADSIVIMVHHRLPRLYFEEFAQKDLPFSWGYDRVYYYRRTFY